MTASALLRDRVARGPLAAQREWIVVGEAHAHRIAKLVVLGAGGGIAMFTDMCGANRRQWAMIERRVGPHRVRGAIRAQPYARVGGDIPLVGAQREN